MWITSSLTVLDKKLSKFLHMQLKVGFQDSVFVNLPF